ncbi:MAG: YMGG-like glycine zipper-containing protein [Verrucomicrobiota bacterium]
MKILSKLFIVAAVSGAFLLTSCTETQRGAALGAGGGAAAGAIIAKDGNEGRGALIGAGVGAGLGALAGKNREQEKRIENLEHDSHPPGYRY